jgi:ABC-2 type transport system permease protein
VVNLDVGNSAIEFIENLDLAGGVQTEVMSDAEARQQLEEGEINWMLVIPESFTADLSANKPGTLDFVSHPDANDTEKAAVELVVAGVAQDMVLEMHVLASLQHMGQMQAGVATEQQAFTAERIVAQAESQFALSEQRPLVSIDQLQPGDLGKEEKAEPTSGVQVAVPGLTVLFVFLASTNTALSIFQERKTGSFRRLLAAPLSKTEMLLGKMMPAFFLVLIQVVVIFLASMYVIPLLGMDTLTVGDYPLAVALLVIVIALCATTLGILVSALFRTESQIGAGATVILWVSGALGGAFFPTFLLTGLIGQLGKFVPHYWATKAFYGLLVRGQDLAGVSAEIGILLGFSLLFLVVGVWRFEFD